MASNTNTTIFPTKKLSIANIFSFPPLLQNIILVLLNLERATLQNIVEELKTSSNEISKSVMKLVEMGYIGKQDTHGEIIFFYVE